MDNTPVFIIDDDLDELEIVKDVWPELGLPLPLEVFSDIEHLLKRIRERVNPFIVISDVNLRPVDGFTLREKLMGEDSLRYKSIPFVFWSTAASENQIRKAYDSGGHGFFLKGKTFAEVKESLGLILAYWTASKTPTVSNSQNGH
jgi:CheY-like chemotaxis protein